MRKYICGKNSVLEALAKKVPIKALYLLPAKKDSVITDVPIKILSKSELDKLVSAVNHQGYVAEIKEFNYFSFDEILKDKPERILILDHIQDPHNFGAILRIANASGIKHILIAKDRQVAITPTVLKVSSGGFLGIKIIRVGSLAVSIKKLKQNNFWIYSTSLQKNAIDYRKASFNFPMALVVGNENKGVSKVINSLADQIIYIPMLGNVQSLNVAVATGILLFK